MRATAVHPGGIQTELSRHIGEEGIKKLIERINAATRAAGELDFRAQDDSARRGDIGLGGRGCGGR